MSLRSVIKSWFQTGDVPTETQYSDTFDSTVIWDDDVKTTTAGNADNEVPTTKAVNDAIALVDLQAVTDIGAETDNPLLVRQASDTQNLFRKNGILHTSEATGGTSTWLFFNTPTGTGSIAIKDAGNGAEVLAFLSDITTGVQSVTGTTVDNTDPVNPIVNVPTLQEVVDAGADTTTQPTINGINIATINDIPSYVGSPVPITRADLLALIAANNVALDTCYKITDREMIVWAKGNYNIYPSAIGLAADRFGIYDITTDAFTPMPSSISWGAIGGTLSSQTDLQTALDGKVDENAAITGATKTKVTYDAKGLITSGADATTADIADSTNKRYVTDAQLTVIGNTSGTNTGDQDLTPYFNKSVDDTDDITVGATNKFATAAEKTKVGFISVTQAVDLDVLESDTVANNAKVSNATHTGEVTGSGALTVDKTAITNKTLVTAASGDKILIADISDSENLKYVTAQTIANLAGGTQISGTAVVDFGSENDWATLTIANASITTTAIKNISLIPIETSTTSLDDFAINNVTFGIENIIDNTSFDVRGIAGNNASGNYTVNYLITI